MITSARTITTGTLPVLAIDTDDVAATCLAFEREHGDRIVYGGTLSAGDGIGYHLSRPGQHYPLTVLIIPTA